MIRSYIRLSLTLLIVGPIALGWVNTPLSTVPTFTPLVAVLTPTPIDGSPEPAIVHGFDGDGPLSLGLLDERAEVLFDN